MTEAKRKVRGENGIFMELGGLALLGIVTWLFIVWLQNWMVQGARADLQSRLRNIFDTMNAENWLSLETNPVALFERRLKAEFNNRPIWPHGRVTITDISFVMPTMPAKGNFSTHGSTELPFIQSKLFADIGVIACGPGPRLNQFEFAHDCQFYGDVTQTFVKNHFPQGLWNNNEHAGHTVGGRIAAKVKVILGGFTGPQDEVPIAVVLAYWKPVRAPSTGAATNGLTIAVAPHMVTDSHDIRFQFHTDGVPAPVTSANPVGSSPPTRPIAPYMDLYNPIPINFNYNMDQHEALRNTGGTATGRQRAFSPTWQVVPPCRVAADRQSAVWERVSGTEACAETPEGTAAASGINSDYHEMLTACMNPAVLVRNMFLYTISYLAGRHGQMRGNTQLMMVGTRHQTTAADISFGPPVVISRAITNDTLDPNSRTPAAALFQIPYVTLFSANKGGWIAPWRNSVGENFSCHRASGATTEFWCAHQALIAQQLRLCYHLYQADGIQLPGLSLQARQLVPDSYGVRFNIGNAQGANLPRGWDQDCPWGQRSPWLTDECQSGGGDVRTDADGNVTSSNRDGRSGLTAFELLSMLGTIQSCPYSQYIDVNGDGSMTPPDLPPGGLCDKNANPLQPDLQALMMHLSAGATDNRAISTPGLYPMHPDLPAPAPGWGLPPWNTNFNLRNHANTRHILIVTHQAPPASEAAQIATLLPNTNRITIVYIPTQGDSAQFAQEITRLRSAFNASYENQDTTRANKLFAFSPHASSYTQNQRAAWGGANEALLYHNYWHELLRPGGFGGSAGSLVPRQSIFRQAEEVFNRSLTVITRKL